MRDVTVAAWVDPVVDRAGHPFHSDYVAEFYPPILGPSAFMLYQRLATVAVLEAFDGPARVDIDDLAACIGITKMVRVDRTLERLYKFGQARVALRDTIEVRRSLPDLPVRWLSSLPRSLQDEHRRLVVDRRRVTNGASA